MAGPRGLRWIVAMPVARPRLTLALLVGLAVGLGSLAVPGLPTSSRVIVGWDALCASFIAMMFAGFLQRGPEGIRAQSARDDEGRAAILALVLAAAGISLVAIAVELKLARAAHGSLEAGHIFLGIATVAASWLMMQLIFAIHYAHEYYSPDPQRGGADAEGLAFPGGEPPDYWDFLHFSVVIGVACQTADVAFTSKPMRRRGTVHGLAAFAYNTVIVALTINLLAGLL